MCWLQGAALQIRGHGVSMPWRSCQQLFPRVSISPISALDSPEHPLSWGGGSPIPTGLPNLRALQGASQPHKLAGTELSEGMGVRKGSAEQLSLATWRNKEQPSRERVKVKQGPSVAQEWGRGQVRGWFQGPRLRGRM